MIDPEEEADFEREYAKMMAESLESRKFERKPLFDAPVPVRSKREATIAGDAGDVSNNNNGNNNNNNNNNTSTSTSTSNQETINEPPSSMMAFSLLTKKGNRQQVSFHLPMKMAGR